MNINEYENQFEQILNGEISGEPYDSEDYLNFVKLNQARIKRWEKKAVLSSDLIEIIEHIKAKQYWILITEPWCGDAANSHVFIKKMAALNPNIILEVQNRDAEHSEIDNYLTNGGRAIPKLIVRDKHGIDLFDWGPRPKVAQAMVMRQKANGTLYDEAAKIEMQKWYNQDNGVSIQQEIKTLLLKQLQYC